MKFPTSGFTLIELLVVIAVVGILAAMSIPAFSSFTASQRLSQSAKQVKNDLRSVQNRAISNIEGKAWGINLAAGATYYTVFKCPTTATYTYTNCSAEAVQRNLPSGFTIESPTFLDLAFGAVSGDLYIDGSLQSLGSFSFQIDLGGSRRTITVSAGGKINETL